MATIAWNGAEFVATDWTRPAWRADLKRHLLEDFFRTEYCQTTTLATFLEEYQPVDDNVDGTLDTFHRRHIISWSNLRRVYVGWANREFNLPRRRNDDPAIEHYRTIIATVLGHFDKSQLENSINLVQPGPYRNQAIATVLTGALPNLNSSRSNLFLGPGRINSAIGENNDAATDLPSSVIVGKPHRTLLFAYAAVEQILPA